LNVRSVARQSASRIGLSSLLTGSEIWLTRGPAALVSPRIGCVLSSV
jgi:hypothetical protein